MSSFDVSIPALPTLLKALADYPLIFQEEMEAASHEAIDYIKSPLREYGPESPTQTYVRSYTLQAGTDDAQLQYQDTGDGFSAKIENPVAYGPYVQGDPDDDPHQTAA